MIENLFTDSLVATKLHFAAKMFSEFSLNFSIDSNTKEDGYFLSVLRRPHLKCRMFCCCNPELVLSDRIILCWHGRQFDFTGIVQKTATLTNQGWKRHLWWKSHYSTWRRSLRLEAEFALGGGVYAWWFLCNDLFFL